jgi:hypothetical protein
MIVFLDGRESSRLIADRHFRNCHARNQFVENNAAIGAAIVLNVHSEMTIEVF